MMKSFTEYELPRALSEYMDQVLHSVSRLECYVTGNVDQDGVSSLLMHICLLLLCLFFSLISQLHVVWYTVHVTLYVCVCVKFHSLYINSVHPPATSALHFCVFH